MKLLSNPVRVRLLARLCERSATYAELKAIAGSRSVADHNLRELVDAGLAVVEREGRGSRYRTTVASVLPPGAWDELPEMARNHLAAGIFRLLYRDAGASMAGKGFGKETHLSLIPMVVDDQGAADVAALYEEVLERLLGIQAESSRRMGEPAKDGRSMTAGLVAFDSTRPAADGLTAPRLVSL